MAEEQSVVSLSS